MPAEVGTTDITQMRVGATEVDAALVGHVQVYARTALPKITAMSISPRWLLQGVTGRNVTIRFTASAGSRVALRRIVGSTSANVPLSGSSATEAAPATDALYRLTASNTEGSTTSGVRFTRAVAPSITSFTHGIITNPLGGSQVAQFSFTVAGHPLPRVVISGGQFGAGVAHDVDSAGRGSASTTHAAAGADPGPITYTLTATTTIDGDQVGTPATRSLTIHWP